VLTLPQQVREPISPLLTGSLPNTNVMMEVQASQEYTGQAIHAVGLVKQWEHYLTFDTLRHGPGSALHSLLARSGPFTHANMTLSGMAAVSNIGNWRNWTGSVWAQANTFGFGRLAWNPTLSCTTINSQWAEQTFGPSIPAATLSGVVHVLDTGWEAFEKYTSPLGIGFVVSGGYGGGPCMGDSAYSASRPTHCPPPPPHPPSPPPPTSPTHLHDSDRPTASHYWMDPCTNFGYSNYTSAGIGCDRTSMGSGYADQYVPAWTKIFNDPTTCPEELLLFFHNLPWSHRLLSSGRPLAQHIYATHDEGVQQVEKLMALWSSLEGLNKVMQEAVTRRFEQQLVDAAFFRDVLVSYYVNVSQIPHGTTQF
jgi:alpha-glucuronidase